MFQSEQNVSSLNLIAVYKTSPNDNALRSVIFNSIHRNNSKSIGVNRYSNFIFSVQYINIFPRSRKVDFICLSQDFKYEYFNLFFRKLDIQFFIYPLVNKFCITYVFQDILLGFCHLSSVLEYRLSPDFDFLIFQYLMASCIDLSGLSFIKSLI